MRKLTFTQAAFIKAFCFLSLFTTASAQTFETPLQKCWFLETPVLRNAQIASDNDNIFLPFPDGIIKSVDLRTGQAIWKSELGGEIFGSLLADPNYLYVLSLKQISVSPAEPEAEMERKQESAGDKKKSGKTLSISALSFSTGIAQWKTDLEIEDSTKAYLFNEEKIIYVITENGAAYILDKGTGTVVSKLLLHFQTMLPPIISGKKIYIGDTTGRILQIALPAAVDSEARDQKILRSIKETPTVLFLTETDLYVGDKSGRVSKINIDSGKSGWAARTGGEITSITGVDEKLLVSSSDNFVYLLSKANGSRVWKKRFQGKNQGGASFTDNVAVISPFGEKSATVIELKKGKTINQISLDSNVDNFFVGSAKIFRKTIILSTLQGFYAFAEKECSVSAVKN